MRRLWFLYAGWAVLLATVLLCANVTQQQRSEYSVQKRNVIMNRIVDRIEKEYADTSLAIAGDAVTNADDRSENGGLTSSDSAQIDMEKTIQQVYYDEMDIWQENYEKDHLPERVTFLPITAESSEQVGVNMVTGVGKGQSVWSVYHENTIIGFVVFYYDDDSERQAVHLMNWSIVAGFLLVLFILIYLQWKIIYPFYKLSEYPERVSKGNYTEKLPESKSRYFGRFIWSVNMLCDKVAYDRKQINRLIKDRQTLLTTIAHGTKTPVANIKLYAEAIRTGLYQEDGIPNPSDIAIAEKIGKNADDIASLIQEMLKTSSDGMIDFIPMMQTFYVTKLRDTIQEEYSNRLKVLRIPFKIECQDKSLLQSDESGILRILSQFIENAIKYGDGNGITIQMDKSEEGHFFTVRNRGELVAESEIPYLFNSFWRGSNAGEKEGSGIGLFEAKQIANRLAGDIYVKRLEDSREMEFLLFIP